MKRRAIYAWLLMIPVAISNGIFREKVVARFVDELPAHQISVVTGSALFLAVAYYMLRDHAGAESDRTLLGIGASWLAATIIFEFGFGRYLDGKTWSQLTHDYNVAEGRLWPVVLLVILLAPLGVKWIVNHRHATAIKASHS